MNTVNLSFFFERDLLKLQDELNLYKNEANIWAVKADINNSAGNLALHLIGNLNHFIGATLGNTGYVRNREAEFALKDIPRAQVLADIDSVIPVVKTALANLQPGDFEKDFPLPMNNRTITTEQLLLQLLAHLSYHLGQINYHRRLID